MEPKWSPNGVRKGPTNRKPVCAGGVFLTSWDLLWFLLPPGSLLGGSGDIFECILVSFLCHSWPLGLPRETFGTMTWPKNCRKL